MHIDNLREKIVEEFSDKSTCTDDERIIYMQDFAIICFFLGNDFLPIHPTIFYLEDILPFIFRIYKRLNVDSNGKFTMTRADGTIRFREFAKFIKELVTSEQTLLLTKARIEFKYPFEALVRNVSPNLAGEPILDFSSFRSEWYGGMMFSRLIPEETEKELKLDSQFNDEVNATCQTYIETFQWVLSYYSKKQEVAWDFHYARHRAPLFYDLYNYITDRLGKTGVIDTSEAHSKKGVDVSSFTTYHQLATVLPLTKFYLLPSEFKKLSNIDSQLAYTFPANFHVEYFGTDKDFICSTLLPFPSAELVVEEVNKILKRLKIKTKNSVELQHKHTIIRKKVHNIATRFSRVSFRKDPTEKQEKEKKKRVTFSDTTN
jgi:5'-3' exonuclease